MTKRAPSINLLRSQDKDFLSRFFEWAMVGGRFIVILTESIALMMFLYRFSLDRQLVDLHDNIKTRDQPIVDAEIQNEAKYRDLQSRLALVKKHVNDGENAKTEIAQLVDAGRRRVLFTNFQFKPGGIKISVSSSSVGLINAFIADVRKLPFIEQVNVETIQNSATTGTVSITVTAVTKS